MIDSDTHRASIDVMPIALLGGVPSSIAGRTPGGLDDSNASAVRNDAFRLIGAVTERSYVTDPSNLGCRFEVHGDGADAHDPHFLFAVSLITS